MRMHRGTAAFGRHRNRWREALSERRGRSHDDSDALGEEPPAPPSPVPQSAAGPPVTRLPIALGQDEQGSAVLVGLALAIVLLVAGIASLDVGVLAAARARAQAAADLAALAALTSGADTSTGRASLIASANGAELTACACSVRQALVTVRLTVALPPAIAGVRLTARARAVLPSLDPPAAGPPRPASLSGDELATHQPRTLRQ